MAGYLTLEEAADRLGVQYKTIYRLVRSGELPAGKVGRIYRVRAEDLDAYFERQKELVVSEARRTGLMALEGLRCCACGASILSELSVGGRCEQTGKEICQACWSIKKIRRCPQEVKAVEPPAARPGPRAASRPPATTGGAPAEAPGIEETIERLRSQGKPVVTAQEAALAEETFLRTFGQRLEQVEQLEDPLSGRALVLRDARVKHVIAAGAPEVRNLPANRVSRFTLKAGGWGRPKGHLVLEAQFVSRADLLRSKQYDAEPIGEKELTALLHGVADRAKKADCFHVLLLGSPTGWTEGASVLVAKRSHAKAFRDKRVAVALCDTRTDQVFLDDSDERLRGFWAILAPARFAAEVSRCVEKLRDLLVRRNSLSLKDAAQACRADTSWVRAAFEELKRDGGFMLDELPDIGWVISRVSL